MKKTSKDSTLDFVCLLTKTFFLKFEPLKFRIRVFTVLAFLDIYGYIPLIILNNGCLHSEKLYNDPCFSSYCHRIRTNCANFGYSFAGECFVLFFSLKGRAHQV